MLFRSPPGTGVPRVVLGHPVFTPLGDVRHIPAGSHRRVRGLAGVPLIPAEVLRGARFGGGALHDDPVQRGLQEPHIMPLGAAHDQGQRDSIRVDEEAALRAFFFPDPSGSARRFPGRAGL